MEPEDSETVLINVSRKELKNIKVQVILHPFDCYQTSIADKNVLFKSHQEGTIKLQKIDGKRIIAMYGVVNNEFSPRMLAYEDTLNSVRCTEFKYFEECLNKISKIKGLKTVAISDFFLIHKEYVEALENFSIEHGILVYVYSKNAPESQIIHKSFGDLLGQIEKWKKEKAGWGTLFHSLIADRTIAVLNEFLQKEAKEYNIFPPPEEIFNAMILAKLHDIKVIIIAQDPYHTLGAAMGLAFSHKDDYGKLQPSLRNIYTELESCAYKVNKKSGDLTKWAKQGVFLINTALTVREGQANSHSKEWEPFTEKLFTFMNKNLDHCVVMMWGAFAQKYAKYFDTKKHKALTTSHPSNYSANNGFFGCKHFIKCNQQLKEWGKSEIDWNLV